MHQNERNTNIFNFLANKDLTVTQRCFCASLAFLQNSREIAYTLHEISILMNLTEKRLFSLLKPLVQKGLVEVTSGWLYTLKMPVDPKMSFKSCTTCKRFLPLANFSRYENVLQGACRFCAKMFRAKYHEQAKKMID